MNIKTWAQQFKTDMMVKRYDEDDTIPNYVSQIKQFLGYFETRYDHPKHIPAEAVKEYLLSKDMVNTQRHSHSAIKLFYKLTVHQEFKFRYIEYAKKEKKLPQIIEEDEIQLIIDTCTNLKHKTIICLLYACGLRVSEVINMKIAHLNKDTIDIICAKGKKDRIVPMPVSIVKLISDYRAQYNPVEYMFNGQFGPQYSERSINQFLKDIAKKAGIVKNIHAHLLRHSYATHSLEQGIDIYSLKEILGHNDTKTTSGYLHCSRKSIGRIHSPINNIRL